MEPGPIELCRGQGVEMIQPLGECYSSLILFYSLALFALYPQYDCEVHIAARSRVVAGGHSDICVLLNIVQRKTLLQVETTSHQIAGIKIYFPQRSVCVDQMF